MSQPKRICIIGAGPAGICAAKVFRQVLGPDKVDVTVWELQESIGGTWIASDVRGPDVNDPRWLREREWEERDDTVESLEQNGRARGGSWSEHDGARHDTVNGHQDPIPDPVTYSAMYFPFHPDTPCTTSTTTTTGEPDRDLGHLFPSHTAVRDYIQRYATHFHVDKLVRVGWKVTRAAWVEREGPDGTPTSRDTTAAPARENTDDENGIECGAADHGNVGDDAVADGDWHGEWEVEVRKVVWDQGRARTNTSSGAETETQTHRYDALVCCTGHYSKDYVPAIHGLRSFKGRVVHSHSFRDPEEFGGKTLLTIGSGASALDIARFLAPHARTSYLSLNRASLLASGCVAGSPGHPDAPGAVVVGQVREVKGKRVVVGGVDGDGDGETELEQELDVDVIVVATGYLYDFPFLTPGPLSTRGRLLPPGAEYDALVGFSGGMEVRGLWKQCIYPANPTLSLPGLPLRIIPFPLFESHAAMAAVVLGTVVCPGPQECAVIEATEANEQGGGRKRHVMGNRQWSYHDGMVEEIERGIERWKEEGKGRGRANVDVGAVRSEQWRIELRDMAAGMRRRWVVGCGEVTEGNGTGHANGTGTGTGNRAELSS
ncbi:hypothetical protein HDU93_009341 [Gonapodya sp. JEL0774]|nr:hypothetical protein HDU93_009341 [Gonapodya sp. JEL0774]